TPPSPFTTTVLKRHSTGHYHYNQVRSVAPFVGTC
ncbi:hypothetical protein A2U01_0093253, partial [Trifolium medium]|nr:hypothetical protein [Trifolium medium]